MMNTHPALRLFVCVKTRMDGRCSCGAMGATDVILTLREELAHRGRSAAHIDVRPCGCLHQCEEGPIVLGFTGRLAEEALPPEGLLKELLHRPECTFTQVGVGQVSAIVDKLLGQEK